MLWRQNNSSKTTTCCSKNKRLGENWTGVTSLTHLFCDTPRAFKTQRTRWNTCFTSELVIGLVIQPKTLTNRYKDDGVHKHTAHLRIEQSVILKHANILKMYCIIKVLTFSGQQSPHIVYLCNAAQETNSCWTGYLGLRWCHTDRNHNRHRCKQLIAMLGWLLQKGRVNPSLKNG